MVNWKMFKITEKQEWGMYVRFCLDDYVGYQDKRANHIDFTSRPHRRFCLYQVGDCLEIDLDRIKFENSGWILGGEAEDYVRGRYHSTSSSSSEMVPENNNNLTSISQNQASGAIQILNNAIDSDERNKYTVSMEVNPKTGNIFYHLSGERK